MDRSSSHRGRQRGNAIVEAALTLTLFLTFLFSIFDFGWVLFYHSVLVHQARTAARWGAVNPANTTAIRNVALYGNAAGTGRTVLGLSAGNVAVARNGTAGGVDDRIVVKITGYQYNLITFGWAGRHPGKDIVVSIPVEN